MNIREEFEADVLKQFPGIKFYRDDPEDYETDEERPYFNSSLQARWEGWRDAATKDRALLEQALNALTYSWAGHIGSLGFEGAKGNFISVRSAAKAIEDRFRNSNAS